MKKEIIINSTLNEERIAITEDGKLAELFIELPDKERSIGNIYLGKVTRIVQGINAAFIDIGLKQDAFLHFSDIDQSMENMITDEEDEKQQAPKRQKRKKRGQKDTPETPEAKEKPDNTSIALRKHNVAKANSNPKASFETRKLGKFNINIEPKQNVIVQIVREAYSSKGVKVTTKIGLPGRYTVLMPFENSIGISRKINSIHERKRLRYLARTVLPMDCGCIIRTAALNKNDAELLNDWKSLLEVWKEIEEKVKKMETPGLLYQDLKIATSIIRDLFTPEVKNVVVDSKKLHKEIITYLKSFSPHLVNKVELYTGKVPVFDKFGVEKELESTSKRKVYLPSGGSIVIDQTEAMVIVDVNSGKSTGEDKHEENALLSNLEAVKEISRQIRLRDIGGMVLIDMIDVNRQKNKKKILEEMRKELAKDRAKTMVYPLTQLSIMQITRQRINQNIGEKISDECPMCQGSGRVTSKGVVSNAMERWLKNFRSHSREFRLVLHVHPHLATYLTDGTISRLSRLMIKYFVKIKVQQSDLLKMDDFRFFSVRQQKDITQDFL
ncbi:MAG: Rne/Rng family ribonuclease [bacterium]